ncbi:type II toxin-antitoxin system antitoxin DNA ADP-ribosyl glycohydrolase DarG [Synechococcus elongatus]|uniref:type II toxin-antitoxin system antitoxin DNA ADP-ribosyl glycohydrolase DarG n=1 Tax=Synechococcus elongatus TaxID=32046 RepID=UPI000F7D7B2E|nr:macro domain-containing protein [Synechococcus elongatus]
MIKLTQGDILKADAEALVNTVNCVGVMGRGIALQFRKAFPENFKAYKTACAAHQMQPGKMFVYDLNRLYNPHFIINFPTKRHWKSKSCIEDIELGLKDLVNVIQKQHIRSVAIPPLGCGLGGLNWEEVRPLIIKAFQAVPEVAVFLFEPVGAPKAVVMATEKKVPAMTVGRAALLGLMRRYLAAVMDPTVTLLEVHKLMYFMQEAGEPLHLSYQKSFYGPYAENLRHVLIPIEGHFISGYGDGEDRPSKPLELKPSASEQAEKFLAEHEETQQRFSRVANLIYGFETAFGMELLATVHWVATREGAKTPEEAIKKVHQWNRRKRMFKHHHIYLAWTRLLQTNWLIEA